MNPIVFGILMVFSTNSFTFTLDFFLQKQFYNPITIEGVILIFSFFVLFDYFCFFPTMFYSTEKVIQWLPVFQFLIFFDFLQYWIHRFEHWEKFDYHRFHHVFRVPSMNVAYVGHLFDTILLVLVPLYICMLCFPMNMLSFIISGSIFSNYFLYIHNNQNFSFDKYLPYFGLISAKQHELHHRFCHCNFGHLFVWNDYLFRTLKSS